MPMMIRPFPLIAAVLLFALLTPSCGGTPSGENAGTVAPVTEATLRAGFARVDVTPAVPVKLAGYGSALFSESACRWSTGVHDPLFAQAMAVEDRQGSAVILIVLDNVGTITNEIVEIQDGIARELGIEAKHVLVSSTHTHHGPDTIGLWGVILPPESGRQEDVIDGIVRGAIRAGVDAWNGKVPARLEYGTGEESRVHFNKVFEDPDRVICTLTSNCLANSSATAWQAKGSLEQ